MTENAQEPPEKIAQKMKLADTSLLVTTYSLSHTQARKKLTRQEPELLVYRELLKK